MATTTSIPGVSGHNWSSSIASATPIAHRGALAGAKVQALTLLEIMARWRPELQKHYYDASRYPTYLEQLGIRYSTTRETPRPRMDN